MYWWSAHGHFVSGSFGYPLAGSVVRHYRRLSQKSLAEVAAACGLSGNLFSRLERSSSQRCGTGLDSLERLRILADLLSIPPELLGLTNPPGPGPWWAAYGAFPAGEDGFPLPGSLICHYRKSKGWKQLDLAEALGLTERLVRLMEQKHVSLDSLSRRRALSHLLKLPPLLLGLESAHLFVPTPVVPASAPAPDLAAIQAIQTSLWTGYYTDSGRAQLQTAQHALVQVKAALPSLSAAERPAWLEQQSLLLQGIVNVTREYADPAKVLACAKKSVEVAKQAENPVLHSLALQRQMTTAYLFHQDELALNLSQALTHTFAIDSSTSLARVLALSAIDQVDRSQVLSLIDERKWSPPSTSDPYHWHSHADANVRLIQSAETLLNLSTNAPDASRLLRQADALLSRVDLSFVSSARLLNMKLTQARVALGLREYDLAAYLAVEAFPFMQQIKSVLVLPQFVKIYQALLRSNYAGSPQVARLGWLLVEAGAIVV